MSLLNAQIPRLCCMLVLPWAMVGTAQGFTCGACQVIGPTTQVGTLTDNLACSFTGSDIIVTGDVTITTPAAPRSGTLVSWTVGCPLSTGASNVTTTTSLDGFVQPPPGTFNPTFGVVESSVVDNSSTTVPGSTSPIPVGLVNGQDNPSWTPAIATTSGTFSYTAPATLKQRFDLDGVYTSGPGGSWIVDVPVRSSLNKKADPTPVPVLSLWGLSALIALFVGSGATLIRRRKPA
jgi:hypothetical protein